MAKWKVQVEAEINIKYLSIKFEREVEADDETEAKRLAEESITEELLFEKILIFEYTEVEASEATTDDVQCDRCHSYFPADGTLEEIGDELVCNGCMTEEEMEDDEEEDEETD